MFASIKKYLVLFTLIISMMSCKKYEEEIITGNIAPPDTTIENNVYEDYINRTYIMVLGREPLSTELAGAMTLLQNEKLNITSREHFLNAVFSNVEYRYHIYEENRFNLLRDNDSSDVLQFITLFNMALLDSSQMQSWPIYQYEVNRLYELEDARNHFLSDSIDIITVQRRMVNNFFYDQLNMNAQNFVLAVFQQLINRTPTQNELLNGVAMVDGFNAIVFFQSGSSKDAFLDIILNTDDYYEGQVVQLYKKYLLRLPTSQEMTAGTALYKNTGDFKKVQIEILKTDEFAGVK